jgi:acyl-homoserine-lactone acylase
VPQLFEGLRRAAGRRRRARPAWPTQVAALRGWDLRWAATSVPTSLAVLLGPGHGGSRPAAKAREVPVSISSRPDHAEERLEALARASAKLTADFGTWQTPWGEINRFQRISGDVEQQYDDSKPSLPVASPRPTGVRWPRSA